MKIAIALRTCDNTLMMPYFAKEKRCVNVDKPTLLLTCLSSLLSSIEHANHDITFSIHDDNSSTATLNQIDVLCKKYNVTYELIRTEKLGNFISQYEWIKQQDAEFFYCVEDDFLHKSEIFNEMINMYFYIKSFVNQADFDYAIYPWNSPQRYEIFSRMYPVMLFKYKERYWKSDLQSTHTFFVTQNTFKKYDDIMKFQAYNWPKHDAWDHNTICKIWEEQMTRLIVPVDSLAYHMSDVELPEAESLWKEYLYETDLHY